MTEPIFIDTETVSLNAPVVLIQWSEGMGPISLWDIWLEPVRETLRLIEMFMDHQGGVVYFNSTFDHFHLHRCYNVLRLLDTGFPTVGGWKRVEIEATNGPCIKPVTTCDVMLHTKRTELQSTMERKPIYIRRVPRVLANDLIALLHERIKFDPIYFSRRKDGYKWIIDPESEDKDFPDIVLRFGARAGLKPLAKYCLGREVLERPTPKELFPPDVAGWDWLNQNWTDYVWPTVDYWANNELARRYAREDVEHTRDLFYHFNCPMGDDDSVLACQVASTRFRGITVDKTIVQTFRDKQIIAKEAAPRAPGTVLKRLKELVGPIVGSTLKSTDAEALRKISEAFEGTSAGEFADQVRAARSAKIDVDLCDKFLKHDKVHLDFKVSGTLTGRMASTGGLPFHGIPKTAVLREAVTMKDETLSVLCGGDFDGSQVAIAAACYNDPALNKSLQSGRKFHQLFAAAIYEKPYEDVTKEEYGQAKNAVFASIFGAQLPKVSSLLKLPEEKVTKGYDRFFADYPGVGVEKDRVYDAFCSMRQPGGIGSAIYWADPQDYMESLIDRKRFFQLENRVCKALYDLSQENILRSPLQVERRPGRIQTAGGAVQSAVYGCAFQIQARNMRQAGNFRIQGTEAEIAKNFQRMLWDLQPSGIGSWKVSLLNMHDELLGSFAEGVDSGSVHRTMIKNYRPLVPEIGMGWSEDINNWSER